MCLKHWQLERLRPLFVGGKSFKFRAAATEPLFRKIHFQSGDAYSQTRTTSHRQRVTSSDHTSSHITSLITSLHGASQYHKTRTDNIEPQNGLVGYGVHICQPQSYLLPPLRRTTLHLRLHKTCSQGRLKDCRNAIHAPTANPSNTRTSQTIKSRRYQI